MALSASWILGLKKVKKMNILTKIRAIDELNYKELQQNTCNTPQSWHHQYRNSAWIHIGGLSFNLTEGDIICVFSQFGEISQIHMPRDRETGRPKGFCFLCYVDTRSCILAVDNLNGCKLDKRCVKVDHVLDFKPPKNSDDEEEEKQKKDLSELGMAEMKKRKEKREYWRKKNMENEEFDHVRRNIRKEGVAPKLIVPENASSDEDDYEFTREKKKRKVKKEKKVKKESETPRREHGRENAYPERDGRSHRDRDRRPKEEYDDRSYSRGHDDGYGKRSRY